MTKRAIALLSALSLAVVGQTVLAGQAAIFERADLGLRFGWSGSAVKVTQADSDHLLDATRGPVVLRVVVRKNERLPEAQHRFRLMSYFAGEWQRAEEECRGAGWDGCLAWEWVSDREDRRGLGMVGYGPGGTYMVVMHAPAAAFKTHRPAMRTVQDSLELF